MEKLSFSVSSYLKSIIGQDLITDDFVAVFELVKNSFDAGATTVDLFFDEDRIVISDNGKGMSYDDIKNKWLFVAYSAKQDGSEDFLGGAADYRASLKPYAGSKGVGRFSCDRLGGVLNLQSKRKDSSVVNALKVNWSDFDVSPLSKFENIKVSYYEKSSFDIPYEIEIPVPSGTVLDISVVRERWDRSKLKALKSSLAKLINPFGSNDFFAINLIAPSELEEDNELLSANDEHDLPPNEIVNGPVDNFIFSTLQEKTTWLSTKIIGAEVVTELTDRGKLIYKISQPNNYKELEGSSFESNIFYLNRSAKATFARRMGINSVSFGSIFLFKNGFRVYPIGEANDDTFGIDRRKQQGYSRYLGTRDVLGKIDVYGGEDKFKESSSRDKGLIETRAYLELEECFKSECFLRLESYITGVTWKFKFDKFLEDPSFLNSDDAKSQAINYLAGLTSDSNVKILDYAKDIFTIIENKIDGAEKTLENLSDLAKKVGDDELSLRARSAAKQYKDMLRAEAEAVAYAEREQKARIAAESAAVNAMSTLEIEKQKNLFLTSLSSKGEETLQNLHHQIIIYSANAIILTQDKIKELNAGHQIDRDELHLTFEKMLLTLKRISAASRFATSANFKMESNTITEDVGLYIEQYSKRVHLINESLINIEVLNEGVGFACKFAPIDLSILIDNLVNNAHKANATTIKFHVRKIDRNTLEISVADDGDGISQDIKNQDKIFEKGVTTSNGSGLGLYFVREALTKMNGTIEVAHTQPLKSGANFIIRIYK
ncbi:putative prophage encoded two-component system histidine kinase [Pseudomonas syringae pv. delphinii]|uniref:histidine kinase n=1 Tax=Pseudomonas syringae pv. delphinii TaxID=192088 RepID=A0A0P9PZ85_9PSED|nr:ATP-binding protein [Pseudomonas syringae group genomosp. 3]KPX24003.1 putative prophage encoded two-component system histidine kinase [Pseudomonas syringae pv. delphinii]RMP16572.1 putative prophage encoded two-component system histidine kinase [Pseudomonas syringae pv. delphinii]RMQ24767.1 putative prophage encoded two-component system histidine kinase [Pseudomonas syringae pv. delphinii]